MSGIGLNSCGKAEVATRGVAEAPCHCADVAACGVVGASTDRGKGTVKDASCVVPRLVVVPASDGPIRIRHPIRPFQAEIWIVFVGTPPPPMAAPRTPGNTKLAALPPIMLGLIGFGSSRKTG